MRRPVGEPFSVPSNPDVLAQKFSDGVIKVGVRGTLNPQLSVRQRKEDAEETFFGAISTCAPASSQRCHVRVRLLPLCRSELLSAVVGSWNLESRHGLLL